MYIVSRLANLSILATYALLLVVGLFAAAIFQADLAVQQSAPQEAAVGAVWATRLIVVYVVARSIEKMAMAVMR